MQRYVTMCDGTWKEARAATLKPTPLTLARVRAGGEASRTTLWIIHDVHVLWLKRGPSVPVSSVFRSLYLVLFFYRRLWVSPCSSFFKPKSPHLPSPKVQTLHPQHSVSCVFFIRWERVLLGSPLNNRRHNVGVLALQALFKISFHAC